MYTLHYEKENRCEREREKVLIHQDKAHNVLNLKIIFKYIIVVFFINSIFDIILLFQFCRDNITIKYLRDMENNKYEIFCKVPGFYFIFTV